MWKQEKRYWPRSAGLALHHLSIKSSVKKNQLSSEKKASADFSPATKQFQVISVWIGTTSCLVSSCQPYLGQRWEMLRVEGGIGGFTEPSPFLPPRHTTTTFSFPQNGGSLCGDPAQINCGLPSQEGDRLLDELSIGEVCKVSPRRWNGHCASRAGPQTRVSAESLTYSSLPVQICLMFLSF